MDFDSGLERALDGESVLFLGAGYSLEATNSRGETFESGPLFATRLASAVHFPVPADIQDAAEAFLHSRGPTALANEVLWSFRATSVTKHHTTIAGVPWRRVYTTNYDNVFELASATSGHPFRPVTLSEKPGDFSQTEALCIHFNGYVERLTSSLGDELKLTDTSYITSSVETSSWSSTFRLDLSMAKSVFFVGYSLADLDISRLLASTDSLLEKTFFIVGPNPTSRTENRAIRYGTPVRFDSAWFGKQIEKKRSRYTPPEHTDPIWYCVKPYTSRLGDTTAVSDKAIFDLFLRGLLDEQLAWNSLHGSVQPYLVQRAGIDRIMRILDNPSNIVIVHSNLGNGKTMLAEAISGLAFAAGRPVYSLSRRSPSLHAELSWLGSIDKPFVLVVDSYPNWMDVLEFVGTHRNENMALFLTARTGPNDVLVDRVEDLFKNRLIHEINLDKIDDQDLYTINEMLEVYGLWGTKAALSREQRVQHLRSRCRAEWQSILVDLFQAPQIQTRFNDVLNTLDQKGGYYDVLLGILALTVLGQRVTIDMLVDIFGNRVLDVAFQRNERIVEFVDFRRGEVLNRSSVAAQFILGRIADPNVTVDVLVTMARSLDRYGVSYRIYNETIRSLVQFSQLESILPSRTMIEKRDATFRYYERVKNLAYCQTNPQFWLQYAIAALVFEDFERAERYFDSAYSFAKRRGSYNTHKIDNHYARLLLEKACRSDSRDVALKLFRSARKIIFEQIQTERLYYPYRVASRIGEFYDTFAGALARNELEEILNAARYIERRIGGLPPELQRQRYVVECLVTMKRICTLAGC